MPAASVPILHVRRLSERITYDPVGDQYLFQASPGGGGYVMVDAPAYDLALAEARRLADEVNRDEVD